MGLTFLKSLVFGKSNMVLYVAIGLVVAGLGGYIYYQDNQITTQKQKIKDQDQYMVLLSKYYNDAVEISENNRKEFKKQRDDDKKTIKLLEESHQKALKQTKTITIIKERIKYVKKEDDGDVAPVLHDTLDRLRRLQATTSKTDNKNSKNKTRSTK